MVDFLPEIGVLVLHHYHSVLQFPECNGFGMIDGASSDEKSVAIAVLFEESPLICSESGSDDPDSFQSRAGDTKVCL